MTEDAAKTDIRVECPGWDALDCAGLAARCFAAVESTQKSLKAPVSILFSSDDAVAILNQHYRGRSGATNVLSFPPGDVLWPDYDYLGDIALAFETCHKEAADKGIGLEQHAAHLLVHGILHLAGYDHQTAPEAVHMESLETQILQSMGIADPHVELETST